MSMWQEAVTFLKSRRKVNLALVVANIVVFIAGAVSVQVTGTDRLMQAGVSYVPYILGGHEYYRLFTAMFLHFSLTHLLYNMICLLVMGDRLEQTAGPVRYLVIYFVSGLAGNLLSLEAQLHFSGGSYAMSAGASGAIFGVIGALLASALLHREQVSRLFIRRLGLMTGLMILQGFLETGTDNMAHIGGVAAGFVLGLILCRR